MNKKRRPRVLVADDLPEIIEHVRNLLCTQCEVIGSATNGQQALSSTITLNPDILVIDISMPILNGFEVAIRVREANCSTKFVFFTMHDDRDYVTKAFACGAAGYVLKCRATTDLLPAIETALQGHTFVSPSNQLPHSLLTGV